MTIHTDLRCVSHEGPGNAALFGCIASWGSQMWYPFTTTEWNADLGSTYEIYFYVSSLWGAADASNRYLRNLTDAGTTRMQLRYIRSTRIFTLTVPGHSTSNSMVFSTAFTLVNFEWYRMVIRKVANGDTTSAPGTYPGGQVNGTGNQIKANIGRVGVTTNGTTSLGPDIFPYGIGTNGGVAHAISATGSGTTWRPILPYGGSAGNTANPQRVMWGGWTSTTGNDPGPFSTNRWLGGYCEERLWSGTLTDVQLASNAFATENAPLVYVRFNETIPTNTLVTYVPAGQTTTATVLGASSPDGEYFAYGGSAERPAGQTVASGPICMFNYVDQTIGAGENPTGFLAHPFTPTGSVPQEITLSGGYKIITTPTPRVLSGGYKAKTTPAAQALDGSYKVKVSAAPTLDGGYIVFSTATPITLDGGYRVTNTIGTPITLDGGYRALTTPAAQTLDGAYKVRSTPAAHTLDGGYKVLHQFAHFPLFGGYAIIEPSVADTIFLSGGYQVFQAQTVITLDGGYRILASQNAITLDGGYKVAIATFPDVLDGGYRVIQSDQATLDGGYRVTNVVPSPHVVSGGYKVGPTSATPIGLEGSYRVKTGATPETLTGGYKVFRTATPITLSGGYEIAGVGGTTTKTIGLAGSYRVYNPDNAQAVALRKLAALRQRTR